MSLYKKFKFVVVQVGGSVAVIAADASDLCVCVCVRARAHLEGSHDGGRKWSGRGTW